MVVSQHRPDVPRNLHPVSSVDCSDFDYSPEFSDDVLLLQRELECLPGNNPETSLKTPRGFEKALADHVRMIDKFWPDIVSQPGEKFRTFEQQYQQIKRERLPNFLGARIPVKSDLIPDQWESRLVDYHDQQLVQFIKYGWPLGFNMDQPPASVNDNHASATIHMSHVYKYIQKELECDAILGPFDQCPFSPWFRTSPMMSRPKRDSSDRRIILDLSFPVGQGVNQGIDTKDHLGVDITYSLPSVQDVTELIKIYGSGAFMWKADLTRAYRQLRADPLDSPLLGMVVDGKIYIDRCPPFGCRSSAAFCQRVANALSFMMAKRGFKIISYLDDFAACCPTKEQALDSFSSFIDLANSLGLKLATHKSSAPATKMEWLGYNIDARLMKISIPSDKLQQLLVDCTAWLAKKKANRKMIQSLASRLIYVSNCVSPARKFTCRILAALRAMKDKDWITISAEFHADISWFVKYAELSNGVYLFNPARPTINIQCDSSLFGGGGLAQPFCYSWTYTNDHMEKYHDIHQLEALNLLVSYQTLAPRFRLCPARVVISTDNMASSWALMTGKTKDATLASCARQLWLLAVVNCHEIHIQHIRGHDIPIPDALSRMSRDKAKLVLVNSAVHEMKLQIVHPVVNDYVFFTPSL